MNSTWCSLQEKVGEEEGHTRRPGGGRTRMIRIILIPKNSHRTAQGLGARKPGAQVPGVCGAWQPRAALGLGARARAAPRPAGPAAPPRRLSGCARVSRQRTQAKCPARWTPLCARHIVRSQQFVRQRKSLDTAFLTLSRRCGSWITRTSQSIRRSPIISCIGACALQHTTTTACKC